MPVLEVVQLVHLKGQVLVSDLKLADSLVVRDHLLVESHLFLLENHLFGLQLTGLTLDLAKSCLELNKVALVGDPVFLDPETLHVEIIHLLLDSFFLVLKWTPVFVTISVFGQFGPLLV